jgi:hypothetical protein
VTLRAKGMSGMQRSVSGGRASGRTPSVWGRGRVLAVPTTPAHQPDVHRSNCVVRVCRLRPLSAYGSRGGADKFDVLRGTLFVITLYRYQISLLIAVTYDDLRRVSNPLTVGRRRTRWCWPLVALSVHRVPGDHKMDDAGSCERRGSRARAENGARRAGTSGLSSPAARETERSVHGHRRS